jgi:hypothetical protein
VAKQGRRKRNPYPISLRAVIGHLFPDLPPSAIRDLDLASPRLAEAERLLRDAAALPKDRRRLQLRSAARGPAEHPRKGDRRLLRVALVSQRKFRENHAAILDAYDRIHGPRCARPAVRMSAWIGDDRPDAAKIELSKLRALRFLARFDELAKMMPKLKAVRAIAKERGLSNGTVLGQIARGRRLRGVRGLARHKRPRRSRHNLA